jgi:hypothetical protein
MSDDVVSRYFEIEPVVLMVARGPSHCAAERFVRSNALMRRLDEIGRRRLVLVLVELDGSRLCARSLGALNIYLGAGRGLAAFRRVCRAGLWLDRWAWYELRIRLALEVEKVAA